MWPVLRGRKNSVDPSPVHNSFVTRNGHGRGRRRVPVNAYRASAGRMVRNTSFTRRQLDTRTVFAFNRRSQRRSSANSTAATAITTRRLHGTRLETIIVTGASVPRAVAFTAPRGRTRRKSEIFPVPRPPSLETSPAVPG